MLRGFWNIIFGIVVGGFSGAIIVSVAASIYVAVRYPGYWSDGQSVFLFFATIPGGAILGALAGLIYGIRRTSKGI
ncbi:MAG: hypothetical protein M3347_00415 [Armatimonadota bacterium]|nr:hypothetical protein [Armatimonadota bacterium]